MITSNQYAKDKENYATTYSYANFSKDFFGHSSSFFQDLVQGSTILQRHVTHLSPKIPFQKNIQNKNSIQRHKACIHWSTATASVSHHVLHTDADLPIAIKGSVEANNVGGVAFMQHLELSDNLVSNGRLDFKVDQLRREKKTVNRCSHKSNR